MSTSPSAKSRLRILRHMAAFGIHDEFQISDLLSVRLGVARRRLDDLVREGRAVKTSGGYDITDAGRQAVKDSRP